MSESVKQALERIENSDTTEDLRAEYLVVRNYIEALEAAIKSGREKGVNMSGFYGEGWEDAVAFIYLLSLEAGK